MTTINNDIIEVLRGVGLSENEAKVYLVSLELGPSPIWDIARASKVKRPTCYVILDELVFRGFANRSHDGKRTVYSVITPKQVLLKLEQRHEQFKRHASTLEAIASKSPQKPSIHLYEGMEGVKQAYNLTLEQADGEILIYGTAEVEHLLPDFFPDYFNKRIKNRISVRAILAKNEINRKILSRDKKELRQTRFLPANRFNPHLEVNIFGDTIIYIAHSEREPFATVIVNSTIVNHEKENFELIWQMTKKVSV